MEQRFFEQPILNSPYKCPARHWELDENRQPTDRIVERRRSVSFITPIPAARKQRGRQRAFEFDEAASEVGTDDQHYELTRMIESVRHSVDEWRKLPRARWRVTPETARLQTALEALYGHYVKIFDQWREADIEVPPCFIVVCNNTATSKLVYDYISGFHRHHENGSASFENGRLELFRNFDDYGNPLARPHTLLIDSEQLDSGEALGRDFRAAATDEIERFRREIVARTGDLRQAESLSDQDLLREVMNTVGVAGRLGGSTRCVVSVSMLTEGWDARTVTHILGVRAFGTQLLCEQVVGRALRRQSYDLNDERLFNVEYADVLGIPFDFTAQPVVAKAQKPRKTVARREYEAWFLAAADSIAGRQGLPGDIAAPNEAESIRDANGWLTSRMPPGRAYKETRDQPVDAWETCNSDTSRPFDRPASGRIAVKVINHLGDEVMKVFRV